MRIETRGDDTLHGSAGADTLDGGAGNDGFWPAAGNDVLDGGAGEFDHVVYREAPAAVAVDLRQGTARDGWGGTDRLSGIEQVTGSRFADTLLGDAGRNLFAGLAGADSIDGRDGSDVVIYSDAPRGVTVDLLHGWASDSEGSRDHLASIAGALGSHHADVLIGDGADNDFRGNEGGDTIDGGQGFDWASYVDDDAGVVVMLASRYAVDGSGSQDVLTGIEAAAGSRFGDHLTGDANGNRLRGMAGDDRLDGGGGRDAVDYGFDPAGIVADLSAGTVRDGWGDQDLLTDIENVFGSPFADRITGNGGRNWLHGLRGADTLDGGGGADGASYYFEAVGVTVDLAAHQATDGGGTRDSLRNMEDIEGSRFNDTLSGDGSVNSIWGAGGDDVITGRGGSDFMCGGDGRDTVVFSGQAWQYVVAARSGTSFTISGPDGTDRVCYMEYVQFAGGSRLEVGSFLAASEPTSTASESSA